MRNVRGHFPFALPEHYSIYFTDTEIAKAAELMGEKMPFYYRT